jgi:hypothetical protein
VSSSSANRTDICNAADELQRLTSTLVVKLMLLSQLLYFNGTASFLRIRAKIGFNGAGPEFAAAANRLIHNEKLIKIQ